LIKGKKPYTLKQYLKVLVCMCVLIVR